VTERSRGLGRKIETAVLEAGHELIATARKPEQLGDPVDRYADRVRPVAIDVTDATAASRADFRTQVETNFFGVVNVTLFRFRRSRKLVSISQVPTAHFQANFLNAERPPSYVEVDLHHQYVA
jgi:NAD(P)-dependent dehydrogenase (short-subunit alcohol dehydrogenase family)